jgi:hypothetical protein
MQQCECTAPWPSPALCRCQDALQGSWQQQSQVELVRPEVRCALVHALSSGLTTRTCLPNNLQGYSCWYTGALSTVAVLLSYQ